MPVDSLTLIASALEKEVVSVDQCFWMNIDKGIAEYQQLHQELRRLHAAGRLVCPIHLEESIFESSMLPGDQRDRIFALQNSLSDELSFRGFGETLNYGTLQLLREFYVPPFRHERLEVPSDGILDAVGAANREAKIEYMHRLSQLPYPPATYRPGMTPKDVYDGIVAERAGSMYRILGAIRDHGTIDTGKDEWEFTRGIGAFLLTTGISAQACVDLIQHVINRRWDAIPQLYVDSTLKSYLEIGFLGGRKAKANDLLDLARISVGLVDGDVVLCDQPMADLVRQSKLASVFDTTKVFSTKQISEATGYFRGI